MKHFCTASACLVKWLLVSERLCIAHNTQKVRLGELPVTQLFELLCDAEAFRQWKQFTQTYTCSAKLFSVFPSLITPFWCSLHFLSTLRKREKTANRFGCQLFLLMAMLAQLLPTLNSLVCV